MVENLSEIFIRLDNVVRDAITTINRNEQGIALVVDEEQRLLGTITDGDIRRAILAGEDLSSPIQVLLDQRPASPYPEPITARVGSSAADLLKLMKEKFVKQLPLLDKEGRVIDLVTMEDLLPDDALPLKAVIMAGGYGTRLSPLTKEIPKPMLPVGDRPLMEYTVDQLKRVGIKNVSISTHYLTEQISEYFGDGSDFGVEINYIKEEHPLGTAGALGLMDTPEEPLLVINGDILTKVDFRSMLAFHKKHMADLTVGVRQYEMEVPYGVLDCDGPIVVHLSEKPRHSFLVNAGIYLLEASVFSYIPHNEYINMTDLIDKLLEEHRKVVSFPILEYWLDIGQPLDYKKAQEDLENGRV